MSGILEDMKVVKLSSHKYVHNVETESDKTKLVDMSVEKDYIEIDEINKNDDEALTGVD